MKKTRNLKIAYLLIYCAIFIVTIYFAIFAISNYITQKKEYELFKQSWQYVADTNIELKTDTNEDGTTETYYAISTPEQLAGMFEKINSNDVNADSISTYGYKLIKNIDLSGKSWIVGDFSNTFDGNSFHIQNLTINNSSSNYLGFVGRLSGTIKNIYFDNIYVSSLSTTNGTKYVGGVVAYLSDGNLENVYVNSGSIYGAKYTDSYKSRDSYTGGIVGYLSGGSISKCINRASVEYGKVIGGVVGQNSATIEKCWNYGEINYTDSTGDTVYVGGVVGKSSAKIQLCQNWGDVLISAYSINIRNIAYTGGIVGYTSANVSECSNNGEISQSARGFSINLIYAGGIAGYSISTFNNCLNTANVSAMATSVTSTSSSNVKTTKVNETEYHKHSYYFFPLWATDYLWYTRNDATISISEMNSYAGGIVGCGTSTISNSYNSGNINGGYKTISVTIKETLKKDSKYSSIAGGNPLTRNFTSEFNVCTEIKSGALNGSNSSSANSGSTVNSSLSLKDKCKFYEGSYASSTALSYVEPIVNSGWQFNMSIGGSSTVTDTGLFTTMQIETTDCNTSSQSSGRVEQKIVRTNNSYTVYTYPERQYKQDGWLSDFSGEKTMLTITNVNTTLVKDNNVKFIDSFSSSNLSTLGNNYWKIEDGEPRLKNLYW